MAAVAPVSTPERADTVTVAPGATVAVLIPCFNEGLSIGRVVRDFRSVLPGACVYVYDNRSTDATAHEATSAGAIVRIEPLRGKGNVVRRMFADIDADVYVIVDGDGTYDPAAAPLMVRRLLSERLDMVVARRSGVFSNAHRRGHGVGNRVFNALYHELFGSTFSDIFSGYRVFSRRFVKSFPAISTGFEIETEMSVHASQLHMPVSEVEAPYGERDEGSSSKLRTVSDATRILLTFLLLYKEIKPARFFGLIGVLLLMTAVALAYPLLQTYIATGLVPRIPTAILATGLTLMSAISFVAGLILDSVARGRLEMKRMLYLRIPASGEKA